MQRKGTHITLWSTKAHPFTSLVISQLSLSNHSLSHFTISLSLPPSAHSILCITTHFSLSLILTLLIVIILLDTITLLWGSTFNTSDHTQHPTVMAHFQHFSPHPSPYCDGWAWDNWLMDEDYRHLATPLTHTYQQLHPSIHPSLLSSSRQQAKGSDGGMSGMRLYSIHISSTILALPTQIKSLDESQPPCLTSIV